MQRRECEKLAEMVRLYEVEKQSLRTIAKRFEVTHQAVQQRLVNAGIRLRSRGNSLKQEFDREILQKLYVEQGLPVYKVAQELGVNFPAVLRTLEAHAINRRTKGHWLSKRLKIGQPGRSGNRP